MTARWRYLRADGGEAGGSEPLADQEAAEAWLANAWQGLADEGVTEVVLEVDGTEAYRMSLSGEGGTEG